MRDRIERFSALPFSIGCVSQSSVAVGKSTTTRSATAEPIPAIAGENQPSSAKMKSSFGLLPLPRPNISAGLQRLIRGFRSLSQLFAAYKEDEDDEVEMEMEIGLPTDVQHVAHIGWDGCNSAGAMKGWGGAPEFLPIPSLSLSQFELAMGAQADGPAAHVGGA